jgi:hypothetical protein
MTDIPKTAMKPADRKPKKAEKPDTLEVTVRGTTLTVPADVLDDFELLDDLNEIDQKQNAARMASVLRRLVGDQWREAMDLARDEKTGRVPIESGARLVQEIMEGLNPNS